MNISKGGMQIRKFLSSIRYHKSENFLGVLSAKCKIAIAQLLMVDPQIRKFLLLFKSANYQSANFHRTARMNRFFPKVRQLSAIHRKTS
jgi:hypothetical protein